MDRRRYGGYIAARQAIAIQATDEFVMDLLDGLAEALLLARDRAEAAFARERVPETLDALVVQGRLRRRAADRLWVILKSCGPPMTWPPTWDRFQSVSLARYGMDVDERPGSAPLGLG